MTALEELIARYKADLTPSALSPSHADHELIEAAREEHRELVDGLADAVDGLEMTVNQFPDDRYAPWYFRARALLAKHKEPARGN